MATQVKMNIILPSDCSNVYFLDATGAYDAVLNPGGFGAPNNAITDFSTAVLIVTLPGSTVPEAPINIYGISEFPSVDTTLAWKLSPSDFGITSFSTGLMRVTYIITLTTGGSYTVSELFLIACEYQCCLDKKKRDIAKNTSSCGCTDSKTMEMLYIEALLEAAYAATCCGDIDSVNDCLAILKTKCSSSSCVNC